MVANEKQLTIIQDAFRDALKANRREDATLLRNCDLAEARMNQRSAPTVFSELVKACEQVDKEYERFIGIAFTRSHFSSRAISVQDARKAVRRSCRLGSVLMSVVLCLPRSQWLRVFSIFVCWSVNVPLRGTLLVSVEQD